MTITSIRDFRLPGWSVTLPRLSDYLAIENLVGVVCAPQLAGMLLAALPADSSVALLTACLIVVQSWRY
jgi:hypothetical protein